MILIGTTSTSTNNSTIILLLFLLIIRCNSTNLIDTIPGDTITFKGYQCKTMKNNNLCCIIPALSGFYCFPQLIIAGSQKSGTTTLSALLSELPGISFAKRKELHFFSKGVNYDKGLDHYLKDFQPWFQLNNDTIDVSINPPISVESTPFYIASPDACRRIASDLPNTTQLILLFREPVARSYSEYQMKKRRVEQQDTFMALVTKYQNEVYNCMNNDDILRIETKKSSSMFTLYPQKSTLLQWSIIENCVPTSIKQHAHWEKFKSGITRLFAAKGSSKSAYQDVLNTCFFTGDASSTGSSNSRKNGRRRRQSDRQLLQINSDEYYNISNDHRQLLVFPATTSLSKSPRFAKKMCLGKFASETLRSMEESFVKEMDDFNRCAKPFRNYQNNVKVLDKVISRCINIQMGIAGQYLYRSMYAPQLYRCHKYIPSNRITVISSETFDKDPLKVLTLISELIGLPLSSEIKQKINSKNLDIDKLVSDSMNKNFPKFQNNSGWRYRSEYDPIPTRYHDQMTEFFKPYNKMFFEYLNIMPYEDYKEWVV